MVSPFVDDEFDAMFGAGVDDEYDEEPRSGLVDAQADDNSEQTQQKDDALTDEQLLAKMQKATAAAETQKVRRPQPKLDPNRLCGTRGIGELPKLFADVKFKGTGHEVEDLNLIMAKLEHWAHRLMPNMRFDDVLARIENHLGHKRPVRTYLSRLRAGEADAFEDAASALPNANPLEVGEVEVPNDDTALATIEQSHANDDWSADVRTEEHRSISASGRTEPNADDGIPDDEEMNSLLFAQSNTTHDDSPPVTESFASSLTQEQQQRIEANRQAALKRLAEKSQNISTLEDLNGTASLNAEDDEDL